jgi:hypothetical protein
MQVISFVIKLKAIIILYMKDYIKKKFHERGIMKKTILIACLLSLPAIAMETNSLKRRRNSITLINDTKDNSYVVCDNEESYNLPPTQEFCWEIDAETQYCLICKYENWCKLTCTQSHHPAVFKLSEIRQQEEIRI